MTYSFYLLTIQALQNCANYLSRHAIGVSECINIVVAKVVETVEELGYHLDN